MNKQIREKVYQKYNGHCAYCGKEIEYKDMQVDHFKPLADAYYKHLSKEELEEINSISNFMPSCRRCNYYKSKGSLESLRTLIEEIPYKLRRDNFIYKVGVDYGIIIESPRKIKFYFEQVKESEE